MFSNIQEAQALANIFNIKIEVFTFGLRVDKKDQRYQVAEWMEPILPQVEVAQFAAYTEGYFPTMMLYHSTETHFDLLVPDDSRVALSGLLGKAPVAEVFIGSQEVLVQSPGVREQEASEINVVHMEVSEDDVLMTADKEQDWTKVKPNNKTSAKPTSNLPYVCDYKLAGAICGAE